MQMTEQIIKYIREQALSLEEITKETGVESDVLSTLRRPLNATELLEICHYLHLDPWCLFQQSGD